jgi:hypothetical protein
MRRGRPVKYDPDIVAKQLDDFVNNNDYPIVKEFLLNGNNLPTFDHLLEMIKDNDTLNHAYKRALNKQEVYIEKGAISGELNPTFSIFKLKQHQFGWKDKQETEFTGPNGQPLSLGLDVVIDYGDKPDKMINVTPDNDKLTAGQ